MKFKFGHFCVARFKCCRQRSVYARTLVEELVAADGWPSPSLLKSILGLGDLAIPPLQQALWTCTPTILRFVGKLLASLDAREALLDMIRVLRRDDDDTTESICGTLYLFGKEAVRPLIEMMCDPALSPFLRLEACHTAMAAAGEGQSQQTCLRTALGTMLADHERQATPPSAGERYLVQYLDAVLEELIDRHAYALLREAFADEDAQAQANGNGIGGGSRRAHPQVGEEMPAWLRVNRENYALSRLPPSSVLIFPVKSYHQR